MDDARYAKRARQACEPCRRKKSKCPGERPVCSYCERLGQVCVYNASGDAADAQQAKHTRDLENRLHSLEGKMDRLIRNLRLKAPLSSWLEHYSIFASPDPQPTQPSSSSAMLPKPNVMTEIASATHDDKPPVPNAESSINNIAVVTESHLTEVGRLYLTWCHCQPIKLFAEDNFLASLSSRDPELILVLEALALRFPPGSLIAENEQQLISKARSSKRIVMDRILDGRVELSTIQSLCLISMVEFASGNVTQSGVNLSIASHLAHSIPPSNNPANAQERKYCLQSIVALQNLQGCIIPATNLLRAPPGSHSASQAFGMMASCIAPELSHNQFEEPLDKSISTLAIHFSVTWRMARAYAANRVGLDDPPPWDSRSDYSMVMQSHHDIDCHASTKYRFANNRIDDFSPEEIQARRQWWMPFLFIQFVHETIPCLLSHPFLLSMRLRSFRQTIPVNFMQQSFEAINRNAGWVIYFIDVLEKKGIQVSDPVLAHCVVIVATIHLQHSFVQDPVLCGKAQAGFQKCMNFLEKMGAIWPCVSNMATNLKRLQDSIVMKPSRDQQNNLNSNRSFSINSQLLWDLLIYDRAVRPDAGWDQSMFGPTLKSDAAEVCAADRVAEFDLVGSAGISAHKAMPNEAAVWPPSEEKARTSVPEEVRLEPPAADIGPSFEDMFFEGLGPHGEQTDRFFGGNDYGRALDDWLNLDSWP
ncbi:uncharacterized protein CTRU02_205038 [Colletotrichum truncatum]|uniref:Uncharacterized protein n=1 Tax=Colletotrichum truncatum TaxID=5467 RepID=A0ACC3Z2U5_COLTU|nr:uncharacterized protein CTRU02_06132 [Colletotrichum truncatum]KAF6793260.1 hypothetical protein CTRU02_06132 [Colletotrichum truncatum]